MNSDDGQIRFMVNRSTMSVQRPEQGLCVAELLALAEGKICSPGLVIGEGAEGRIQVAGAGEKRPENKF